MATRGYEELLAAQDAEELSAARKRCHGASRKTLYTLRIDDYSPAICHLTFPLLKAHAAKIGAEFHVITERKFLHLPVTYEKFQVADLARERGDEWSIYFDADTLVNPEQFDITDHLPKDTVAHNGKDLAGVRWTYDEYFRRDGRHISSCTWCVIASEWTVQDLWCKTALTQEQLLDRIHTTVEEKSCGHCEPHHLVDDYLLSRNIARFGLKFTTVVDICGNLGMRGPDGRGVSPYLWHLYTIPEAVKIRRMLAVLSTPLRSPAFEEGGDLMDTANGPMVKTEDGRMLQPCGLGWGLMSPSDVQAFAKRYGLGKAAGGGR